MDLLSVAASVGGLLQVSSKVIDYLSSMVEADRLAQNVHIEAVALKAIFHQLQVFISEHPSKPRRGKAHMIFIDHIVVTLTGCVCAFDELERELQGVKIGTGGSVNMWNRVKWAQKDSNVRRILRDLERIKSSLTIMVDMDNCRSTREAEDNIETLIRQMDILLESNASLSKRIGNLERTPSQIRSDRFSIRSKSPSILSTSLKRPNDTLRSLRSSISSFSFEESLANTRVYRNALSNQSTRSFLTLKTSESKWSQLSGLPLSKLSNISIIYLPVTIDELFNPTAWRITVSASENAASTRLGKRILSRFYSLHNAVRKQDKAAVQMILNQKSTDVNSFDIHNDNETPLHIAIIHGNETLVRLLIESGADIEIENLFYGKPLHAAIIHSNEAIVRILIDSGADIEAKNIVDGGALHTAISYGCEDLARLFIDKGADIEAKTGSELTPLHAAIIHNNEAIVRLLVGMRANTETENIFYGRPLHAAIIHNNEAIVRLLIDNGADIEAKNRSFRTPLNTAIIHRKKAIVQLLIDSGANIEAKNSKDRTPLHVAAGTDNRVALIQLLLDSRANINAKDIYNKTPLDIATLSGNFATARFLEDYGALLTIKTT